MASPQKSSTLFSLTTLTSSQASPSLAIEPTPSRSYLTASFNLKRLRQRAAYTTKATSNSPSPTASPRSVNSYQSSPLLTSLSDLELKMRLATTARNLTPELLDLGRLAPSLDRDIAATWTPWSTSSNQVETVARWPLSYLACSSVITLASLPTRASCKICQGTRTSSPVSGSKRCSTCWLLSQMTATSCGSTTP